MKENTFHFQVFSGRGLEFNEDVTQVLLPGIDGQLGILANHCDYVGLLGTGIVKVDASNGENHSFVLTGGFCKFARNTLTILADSVDMPGTADLSTFEAERVILNKQMTELNLFDPASDIVPQKLARLVALEELEKGA